ncbi:MAG: hypothetical protein FWD69_10945 [Polyangiaceae bacterium]|nr:hypothetical protein [Polyangiaceae bacterium]
MIALALAGMIGCTSQKHSPVPAPSVSVAASFAPAIDAGELPAWRQGPPDHEESRLEGATTVLIVDREIRAIEMDAPDPSVTRITLRARADGDSAERHLTWDGDWGGIVWSNAIGSYVLERFATVGSWYGIVGVRFLGESGTIKESRGASEPYVLAKTILMADGKWVAFIAQTKRNEFRRFVLNVAKDKLQDFGVSPDPTPMSPKLAENACRNNHNAVTWSHPWVGGPMNDINDIAVLCLTMPPFAPATAPTRARGARPSER